jgi:hypothetical protein
MVRFSGRLHGFVTALTDRRGLALSAHTRARRPTAVRIMFTMLLAGWVNGCAASVECGRAAGTESPLSHLRLAPVLPEHELAKSGKVKYNHRLKYFMRGRILVREVCIIVITLISGRCEISK